MASHVTERLDLDLPDTDPEQVRLHVARYEFAAARASGKRVLDVACGTGYGTARLSAAAASVHGIDVEPSAVESARAKVDAENVCFTAGDAEDPPVTGPFDVIVSFETIEHLRNPERFLASVCRLLTRDGTFIVSTPCRHSGTINDKPENPFHIREWNQAEFRDLLGRYFMDVTIYGQLVEFAKNRLPMNRTLARAVGHIVMPRRMKNLYSYEVRPLENLPFSKLRVHYQVAVCQTPR